VLLAGWLFADLAVGLVIILLATATDTPLPAPTPTTSAIITPTESPSPSPSPIPVTQLGLEQEPLVFRVQSDAAALLGGDNDEIDEVANGIRERLGPYEADGRKAGFVLTWGGSSDPGEGVALARAANKVLRRAVPGVTETAAVRDLWKSQGGDDGVTRGTLIFEVFLFVKG
jgi:hypothetical protein